MKNWIKHSIVWGICLALVFGQTTLFTSTVSAVEGAGMVNLGGDKKPQEPVEQPDYDEKGRPILSEGAVGVLMDGKSGNILFESGGDKKMYPASTTKVMTALLALEAVKNGTVTMDQEITVTSEMIDELPWDGSNIALKEGEVISFRNLLYGLMIPSGNDAAMAIAYTVSGSKEGFVDAMNQRATELGLTRTRFENPHGLHDENHYTTAAEMAVIAWHAMQNEEFRNIVGIAHVKIPPTNKTKEERYYINTNGLISTMRYTQYYYEGATGIKTGFTNDAGNCLVASAKRGDVELITVLFHGEGVESSHEDSARMLDYGFSNFEMVTPVKKNQILGEVKVKWGSSKESVTVSSITPISVLVPLGTNPEDLDIKLSLPKYVKSPVEKGTVVGTVTVSLDGVVLGEGELHADLTVKRSFLWPLYAFLEWLWSFLVIRILCYLILGVLGAFVILLILRVCHEIDKVRRRKKRRREREDRN